MYTKTISIPHIDIEDAIIQMLIERQHIKETDNIDGVDLGLALNEFGEVEIDLEFYDDDDGWSEPEADMGPMDGSSLDWLKKQVINA